MSSATAEDGSPFSAELVQRFRTRGWWGRSSLNDMVRDRARTAPERDAYGDAGGPVLTWADYDATSDSLLGDLAGLGVEPGDRIVVWLPDGPALHTAYLAVERAGGIVVGIPDRASRRDVDRAISVSRPVGVIGIGRDGYRLPELLEVEPGRPLSLAWSLALEHPTDPRGSRQEYVVEHRAPRSPSATPRSPEEVFFVNTTSGTTGRPKAVAHNQHRWIRCAQIAIDHAGLRPDDRILSLVPSPYGFGLWSSHLLPGLLGAPTFQVPRWDPDQVLGLIERERITVVMAVTTQLLMLLDGAPSNGSPLERLRVAYTGGERISASQIARFEDHAGAVVVQFYGSNEAGAVSGTRIDDPVGLRRGTAGRVLEEMDVRLIGSEGAVVTERPGEGQVAVRGPLMCSGYVDAPEAMSELLRDDGWMLLPDLGRIDQGSSLTITGRVSELIIRGGLNISIQQVEGAVASHPEVTAVAVVPVADETYGERVCAVVTVETGSSLDLRELSAYLRDDDHATYLCPERLLVVDSLPMSPGGKVDRDRLQRAATGERVAGVEVRAIHER